MKIALLWLVLLVVPLAEGADDVLRVPSLPPSQLIHKVDPEYPPAARAHRIHGTVRFQAIVGKNGHVERLRLMSGHPLLRAAARKAARQWVYRPVIHNGQPARVATVLEVAFDLNRAKEHHGSGAAWTFQLQCSLNVRRAVVMRA